jgi:ribosomal-protein-alanine N-acetyltransferase
MDRIVTERFVLRRFEPGDAPAMHAIMSDPAAMQYWSSLPHTDIAQTEDWIARTIGAVAAGDSDDFAVTLDGELVGKAGLWKGDELGMIFAPCVWGTGLAAEAVAAVIARARARGVRTVTADVDPRNVRAVRFLERFGFVTTGSAERTYRIGEAWTDSVYLELALDGGG